MKTEPLTDKRALIHTVRQEYGIDAAHLTFIPLGEVSTSYVVDCAGGDRYFLKRLDDSRLGRISASRLDFYLPVTWSLHSQGLFRNLPLPVRTRNGDFYTYFDGLPLVLFNFIAGQTLDGEHPLSDATLAELARSVAVLHKSTTCSRSSKSVSTSFSPPTSASVGRSAWMKTCSAFISTGATWRT